MITEIATSIRLNLEDRVPEVNDVQLIYDGSEVEADKKPVLTVEYLFDTRETMSAGMRSRDVTYSFQIGVFAKNISERFSLQEKVAEVLENPDGLILYTETGIATDSSFYADVSAFTPMLNDDTASDTNNHRGYFDVSINVLKTYGDDEFTQ